MTAAMFWWTLVKGHVTRRTDQSFVRAKTLHLETDFFSLSLSLSDIFFPFTGRRPQETFPSCISAAGTLPPLVFSKSCSHFLHLHLHPHSSSRTFSLLLSIQPEAGGWGGRVRVILRGRTKREEEGWRLEKGEVKRGEHVIPPGRGGEGGREGEDKRREEVEPLHTTSTQWP